MNIEIAALILLLVVISITLFSVVYLIWNDNISFCSVWFLPARFQEYAYIMLNKTSL